MIGPSIVRLAHDSGRTGAALKELNYLPFVVSLSNHVHVTGMPIMGWQLSNSR